jgi:hypothetical protein
MSTTPRVNFVRQQGFVDADAPVCSARYPALMFQPRVVLVLLLVGIVLQAGWYFVGLGAVLAWSALFPRLNPFDALYNAVVARRGDGPRLPPAPAPRRFAQGLAGTLMLIVGVALLAGRHWIAWSAEGFLVVAVAALVFGKFCLGSFLFHHLRGDGAFARRTAPWASTD